ncbi:Dyp-type peroxidase [Natronoglycomyces albus]|uniref:Dyp-type peroxidase n=1 Tax=Natronoglycomyces albus TaxID=2811108 RepID=A0A895XL37_9ACTN|nr:Dyp-type peroxidase [Natronoglycomyces albus]QSB04139.1 Dyp-type peroxidase [Natronoglycomyces albus]
MSASENQLSRRRLLGYAAATTGVAASAAAGAMGGHMISQRVRPQPTDDSEMASQRVEAFFGPHQAGIATDPQAHALLLAFDLNEEVDLERFMALMRIISDDAARLTQGQPALADNDPTLAKNPAGLTVTFGFGPMLFTKLGLATQLPEGPVRIPGFDIDRLDVQWTDGDLIVQLCADDELALIHAQRMMVKDLRAFMSVRWAQRGFRPLPTVLSDTPRNVMGQLDGTSNPRPGTDEFSQTVWADAAPDVPEWFTGGTTMVVRRIRVELDEWDRLDEVGKELALGRKMDSGAPLGGTAEHDEPDFAARKEGGLPVIPTNAHIRRAHSDDGARIFRRSYNFDAGPTAGGTPEAGLLFVSFQARLRQFVAIQERLAEADMLNSYTTPVGSSVFFVPPGCEYGGWVGQTLLDR